MDDCATVTSGARGSAADNPTTQTLTPLQKARSVAFVVGSASSFGVTISVDKCFGNRGVMFGGKQVAMCPAAPQVYTPPLQAVTVPPVAIETTPAPIIHVDPPQPKLRPATVPPVAIMTTPAPVIHVDPVPPQPKIRPATVPPVAIETTPAPVIHVDPVPVDEEAPEDGEDDVIEDTTNFCRQRRLGNQFKRAGCVRRNGRITRTAQPNRRKRRSCTRPGNVWCRIGGGMAKKRSVNLEDFP